MWRSFDGKNQKKHNHITQRQIAWEECGNHIANNGNVILRYKGDDEHYLVDMISTTWNDEDDSDLFVFKPYRKHYYEDDSLTIKNIESSDFPVNINHIIEAMGNKGICNSGGNY